MEGKNAAFSRNQTGKKEEKKGKGFSFFHAGQHAERERDRALALAAQGPTSRLVPKNMLSDGDVRPAVKHTHTPTFQSLWGLFIDMIIYKTPNSNPDYPN